MHARRGRCNAFAISQNCAKVEVACMGERGITRPMLILGRDRCQIHCWNIFQQRSCSIGKASLEGLLFHYERCSGHQGLEGKKQEPGRVRGMRTPVVFAVTSRRGKEGVIGRLSPTCSSPRQGVKDCRSMMTKRTSEEGRRAFPGETKRTT